MSKVLTLTLITALFASQIHATVINGAIVQQNGNGTFVKLDTDVSFDVGRDNFNTDHLYAFDEDQNIVLDRPIRVDIGGEAGVIRAGATVASRYVFFDSVDSVQFGYVDFDAPILGIAAQPDTMDQTDFLANTTVNYISTDLRGLETGDEVWIDEDDPFRLWVLWAGSSPGDYIRVFTARSPAAMM